MGRHTFIVVVIGNQTLKSSRIVVCCAEDGLKKIFLLVLENKML